MKAVFVIVFVCCCIEFSYQRNILRKDDGENDGPRHLGIVKRDLGDDFFDKLIQKGKSLFVDDDENNNESNNNQQQQHDSDSVTTSFNHGTSDNLDNNANRDDGTRRDDNRDDGVRHNGDRDNTNTNANANNDNSNTHHSKPSSNSNDSSDDWINEETLKGILAKVVAYASSSDSDNQEQQQHDGSNTEKTDGSDSDALMDKLGGILIREGIKIGVAELASSAFGKK